jgi:hypothetical protein
VTQCQPADLTALAFPTFVLNFVSVPSPQIEQLRKRQLQIDNSGPKMRVRERKKREF